MGVAEVVNLQRLGESAHASHFLFRMGCAFRGGRYPTLVEITSLPLESKGFRPALESPIVADLESQRRDLSDDFLFDFPLKAYLSLILFNIS